MRIVSKRPLVEFYDRHPDAREAFEKWYEDALEADWGGFAEVKATFPPTDLVKSGRGTFLVFDLRRNRYRIVCAVHFNTRILFVRYAGNHAGYDRLDFDTL